MFQVLSTADFFSRDTGNVILNLIISVEMVFVAMAQSKAFSYHDFADACSYETMSKTGSFSPKNRRKSDGLCHAIG